MECNEIPIKSTDSKKNYLQDSPPDNQILMDDGEKVSTSKKTKLSRSPSDKKIDTVKKIDSKPISPDPLRKKNYDQNDDCDLPFCPKHGFQARARKSLDSTATEFLAEGMRTMVRSKSINFDNEGKSVNSAKTLMRSRSVQVAPVTSPEKSFMRSRSVQVDPDIDSEPMCIKNEQRKRMRELRRISSDLSYLKNIDKMDKVTDELIRRTSAPPAVSEETLL